MVHSLPAMNATSRRTRYRAELRDEILNAARALVKEQGYERLTIRQVAQRMGYSPMALYSYFADKQAILFALAQEGFQRLADRLRHRVPSAPLAALRKTMTAYVEYGIENPEEYRIVFMSPEAAGTAKKTQQEMAQDHPAFAILLQRVAACVEAGHLPGEVFLISTLLWTGMHGVTSLLITSSSFPFGEPGRYVEAMVETMLAGLKAGGGVPPR
jgi:AcrR family transcriptional regulator